MKKISLLLVICLLGTLSVKAQTTTVPTFRTVQVRPGIIKVPSFSLRAGTPTRLDLKSAASINYKVVTDVAPGQLVGAVEVGTTPAKLNIELTPKNFLDNKWAYMYIYSPVLIYENFWMGDNNDGSFKNLAAVQAVLISIDVASGKQYLVRIPVTVDGTATRSFLISTSGADSSQKLFTTTFSGSQEIAFTLVPQNTGTIVIGLYGLPTNQTGLWSFSKVIISEL